MIANAAIEARNRETGAVYPTQTTATGNYTLSQLPAGSYELTVTVPGFKKYVRQALTVEVAGALRIDVGLEVGNASESTQRHAQVMIPRRRRSATTCSASTSGKPSRVASRISGASGAS